MGEKKERTREGEEEGGKQNREREREKWGREKEGDVQL